MYIYRACVVLDVYYALWHGSKLSRRYFYTTRGLLYTYTLFALWRVRSRWHGCKAFAPRNANVAHLVKMAQILTVNFRFQLTIGTVMRENKPTKSCLVEMKKKNVCGPNGSVNCEIIAKVYINWPASQTRVCRSLT